MQLLNQNEEINKMDELKKHIYDENNGLHYTLVGGYYVPDLKLSEENHPIGHYGGCIGNISNRSIRHGTVPLS